MSVSAAAMFAGAGLLGVMETLTSGGPEFSIVPSLLAIAIVPLILLAPRYLPRSAFAALGPIGTFMLASAIVDTRGLGDDAVMYVWPVLWTAHFFGRRATIASVAAVGVAHAAAIAAMPAEQAYFDRWLEVMVSVAIVAGVVRALTERSDRLVATLLSESRHDALTGVLNRRGFHERLELEVQRARRSGEPLAVIALDIDHFKAINDHHGHATGDRVLTWVATTILAHTRAIDLVARLGGDEFVVVLAATDADRALAFAERLRSVLGDPSDDLPPISISAGIANGAEPDIHALLDSADRALYEAKSDGRDRVAVASAAAAAVADGTFAS
jgi:diguanylate cyclase (GGDEF)-like protein